jgi:hypothetical protein
LEKTKEEIIIKKCKLCKGKLESVYPIAYIKKCSKCHKVYFLDELKKKEKINTKQSDRGNKRGLG